MVRISKGALAATLLAGAVLHGSTVAAQVTTTTRPATTTTTTTSTTTTTLQPHPYSRATRDCVRRVQAQFSCRKVRSTCSTDFQTAFSNCFLAPNGVKCAKSCIGKEVTCLGAAPKTRKTCRKTCGASRRADYKACKRIAVGDNIWAGGDASCFPTADSNFHLCLAVCDEALTDCRTNFTFCIADCPNL